MLADFFSTSFGQIEGLSAGTLNSRKSQGLFQITKVRVLNHSESSNNPLIEAYDELFISSGYLQ